MPLYKLEVSGAMYVDRIIEVEATDELSAFVASDDELTDWDEIHNRTIVAVGNIAVTPVDSRDFLDEIEIGFAFEPDVLEGADLPSPGELVEELVDTTNEDEEPLGDMDFFLDEDGEQVGVRVQDYEQDGEGM